MRKVLVSVEGQTEETFLREVLQQHFGTRLFLQPVVLKTKRVPGRPAHKGGHVSYAKIRRELLALLGDTSAVAVTTMYDLYALPDDFPSCDHVPCGNGAQKVAHLEGALRDDISDPRFYPYIQVHEFEALLFSAPDSIVRWMGGTEDERLMLQRVRQAFPNPEEIDDSPITSPSHRIRDVFSAYEKVTAGSLIAIDIGLPTIRDACPHFAAWVDWLESLV
jgi:hypothetical protein